MISMVLIALAAPAAAALPTAATPQPCRVPGITYTARAKAVTSPRRLGDLPPARHYLAVVRDVGGCPEPAVLRSGIGHR